VSLRDLREWQRISAMTTQKITHFELVTEESTLRFIIESIQEKKQFNIIIISYLLELESP